MSEQLTKPEYYTICGWGIIAAAQNKGKTGQRETVELYHKVRRIAEQSNKPKQKGKQP